MANLSIQENKPVAAVPFICASLATSVVDRIISTFITKNVARMQI